MRTYPILYLNVNVISQIKFRYKVKKSFFLLLLLLRKLESCILNRCDIGKIFFYLIINKVSYEYMNNESNSHMSFCVHVYSNAIYEGKAAFKKIDDCITDLFHLFPLSHKIRLSK